LNRKNDILEEYNSWSKSYDNDSNPTRDLDSLAVSQNSQRYKAKRIIEIGCGTGKNTTILAEIGSSVHALDFSPGMIEIARKKLSSKDNVEFTITDIRQKWPLEDKSADVITCSLVLEHIENLEFIFSEANRILMDSGEFFISELHPYRQYQGKKANYIRNNEKIEITAYKHDVSEFVNTAIDHHFKLERIDELHDENDTQTVPRLITFIFKKLK